MSCAKMTIHEDFQLSSGSIANGQKLRRESNQRTSLRKKAKGNQGAALVRIVILYGASKSGLHVTTQGYELKCGFRGSQDRQKDRNTEMTDSAGACRALQ